MLRNIFKSKSLLLSNKNTFNFSNSLFLKGGTVVNVDLEEKADVLIKNGKIIQVGDIKPPVDAKVIDATGKFVMPGGIDTHTHMQLPFMGTVAVDDFNLGTRAAIAGGTTSILDFVIPAPGKSLIGAYEQWQNWAKDKVNCNYGFHIAITSWLENTEQELAQLVQKEGIQSFKVFLAYKGAFSLGNEGLIKVMEAAKKLGAIVMAHCEDAELIYRNQQHLLKLGVTGPEGHYLSRNQEVEGLGTRTMITIADQIGSPVYVVHVQSKVAVDEVNRARSLGMQTYGETLVTGFTCDGKMIRDKDFKKAASFVMSPPINPDTTTHEYLLNNLQCGNLHTIATDNCTFCSDTKKGFGENDFTKIPNGCNGIEDRMNITWTKAVNEGYFTRQDYVRLTSYNAAQIFNLYPRKGAIRAGSDADVIILDPKAEKIISAKTHHQAVDTNVFEGMHCKGLVTSTILNGDLVYHEGVLSTKQGSGQYLKREPFGYPFQRTAAIDARRDPVKQKVDRSGTPEPPAPTREEMETLQKQVDLLAKENKQLKSKLETSQ
ncbi:Metal-dependent hydrolase, composite domain [Pseudocohnilembus persalinus]|uniref:dihydropyrimidinase n=1 Tax=Pseudocohnilembus persalinus TaxID=266149 RepID=A0A0V0R6U1_PSEPJ|nr:Metal-dependent hydrolase, composite domain [Pseudocohnilembus persalinus]|eukprot:KRX10204.1 Metal-dependent hydrolase, composite domain [Pseudocohnilembus persalinus]